MNDIPTFSTCVRFLLFFLDIFCVMYSNIYMFLLKAFHCKILFQIPALQDIEIRTNPIIEEISSLWDKLKSLVLVDKAKFPEKSYRFTAIYSRDKEYLLVFIYVCF